MNACLRQQRAMDWRSGRVVGEGVGAGHALAAVGAAYYTFLLSKYLAARTADMIFDGIYRLASSPLEVGMLSLLALWFISWNLDRHARAAQIFSTLHLRLLSAIIMQSAQRASASRALDSAAAAAKAAAQLARGGGKGSGNSSSSAGGSAASAPAAAPSPSPSTARRLALPPSPGKDVSSFRLPDHIIAGGGNTKGGRQRQQEAGFPQQQRRGQAQGKPPLRWSMDAAGGVSTRHQRQQVRTQPKPRTSVDFDAAPTSPPPRRPRQQQGERGVGAAARARRGASLADHRAAPALDSTTGTEGPADSKEQQAGREQSRWQPRMQRIASGQELADLAVAGGPPSARSSLDDAPAAGSSSSCAGEGAGSGVHTKGEQAGQTNGADCCASSAGPAAAAASSTSWLALPLSLSLSLPLSLSWPPSPGSEETSPPSASAPVPVPAASDGASSLSLPASPTASAAAAAAAAAAVARRVAASGSAAAAWATSTVDSVLRPFLPGGLSSSLGVAEEEAAAEGAGSSGACGSSPLQHAASMPLPAEAAAAGAAMCGLAHQASASACSAADRRRQSLDGVSARHYSHGAVTADPARKPALENLACAARMQSRSCAAAASLGQAGALHPPGHPTLACSAPSAAGCLGPDAGTSALASVGLDGDCPQEIRAHVTDEHLIQFAAVAGEQAAVAAAAELGLPAAWAGAVSLLSAADGCRVAECGEERWEQVVQRSSEGLSYEVWRQELRRGLFMYRSCALFPGVSPRDLRPFHLDDHARHLWDENVIEIRRVKPESQPGRVHKHSEWCLHQYRSRFPRPLAAREYQYARRVWHRPSDGGCYVLCRGLALPDAGDGYRAVRVTDIVSGSLIRAAPGSNGASSEMLSLYFEDSGVRPGLAKMAVKGMWNYMQNYEGALRVFAEARQAAAIEYAASLAAAAAAGGGGSPSRGPALSGRRRSMDQRELPAGATPLSHSSSCQLSAAASLSASASSLRGDPQQKQRRHRRRQLLPQLAEDEGAAGAAGSEDEGGSTSGDDALHSTYAAMARRLRRAGGGAGPSRLRVAAHGGRGGAGGGEGARSRWAGRLVVLASIKMVHTLLTTRR